MYFEDWIMSILGALLAFLFLCLILGIGFAIYDEVVAEKFELRKDTWECTKSHQESSTYYVQSGNVMIPMTSTSTVCDQWSRK